MKVRWFAALVAAPVVVMSLAGCSAGAGVSRASSSMTPSSETPTGASTPTNSATPGATTAAALSGFDLAAVYAACDAAVPAAVWGGSDPIKPDPPTADAFGHASADGYAKDRMNGDPNAIYINVTYENPDGAAGSALCVASGDPAAPTVTYLRTLD